MEALARVKVAQISVLWRAQHVNKHGGSSHKTSKALCQWPGPVTSLLLGHLLGAATHVERGGCKKFYSL
jgi:hypothetical protein